MTKTEKLEFKWRNSKRWRGVQRDYSPADVLKLRGSVRVEHTIARISSKKLWQLLHTESFIRALGACTGHQAVQMVRAGLKAIYMSGWQVAADANNAGQTYPDQSLYPVDSVPTLVKRINNAFKREDEKNHNPDSFAPIVADAEAGFGGSLNAYELMKAMIEAGAAGVHFEDQLGSEKKCGHLGGKVLVPTAQFIRTLIAARLAADVLDVPTVLVARTDADAATLLTSEIDDRDKPFILGMSSGKEMTYGEALARNFAGGWNVKGDAGSWTPYRTVEGFFKVKPGLEIAIARGVAYAPYADLVWCETSKPNLEEARKFAEGIHRVYPGKMLAYNCSPSFNWELNFAQRLIEKLELSEAQRLLKTISNEVLADKSRGSAEKFLLNPEFNALVKKEIAEFQSELAKMGYKFQFVTLAGFHTNNFSMFDLAQDYAKRGMAAYVDLQEREFAAESQGYEAVKHQRFVGTAYFDEVAQVISGGKSSTTAMDGSTEKDQFKK